MAFDRAWTGRNRPSSHSHFSISTRPHPTGAGGRFEAGLLFTPAGSTQWRPTDKNMGAEVKTPALSRLQDGVCAEWILSRAFEIRAELRFSRKGAGRTMDRPGFPSGPIETLYEYDDFEVPILRITAPLQWPPVSPALTGGLYAAWPNGSPRHTFPLSGLRSFSTRLAGR